MILYNGFPLNVKILETEYKILQWNDFQQKMIIFNSQNVFLIYAFETNEAKNSLNSLSRNIFWTINQNERRNSQNAFAISETSKEKCDSKKWT